MGKSKFVSMQVLQPSVKINFADLEIFTLLTHCAAYCGNLLQTFRDNLSSSSSKVKKSKCGFGPEEIGITFF